MTAYMEVTRVRVDSDESVSVKVIGEPMRLTFPDGSTIDLAVGQEFQVQVVETKSQPEPTDGWAWVRDSMRRGDEAAERRLIGSLGLNEVIDRDGDVWTRDRDGLYRHLGARRTYYELLNMYGPLTSRGDR